MPPLGILVLVAASIILVAILSIEAKRKREQARAVSEPISILFAEHVARSNRWRTQLFIWLFATNLVAAVLGAVPSSGLGGCVLWGSIGIHRFMLATNVLRLAALPGAKAELLGQIVIVHAGRGQARIWATKRVVGAARRKALPEARAAR
jgi:hypothetical protein